VVALWPYKPQLYSHLPSTQKLESQSNIQRVHHILASPTRVFLCRALQAPVALIPLFSLSPLVLGHPHGVSGARLKEYDALASLLLIDSTPDAIPNNASSTFLPCVLKSMSQTQCNEYPFPKIAYRWYRTAAIGPRSWSLDRLEARERVNLWLMRFFLLQYRFDLRL